MTDSMIERVARDMASPTLEDIPKARVVVVGDAMIDRWVYGRIERISPEAPVPVFIQERVEEFPGGALNVDQNLADLGCNPVTFFTPEDRKSVKTRYVVGSQHILRVDEDKLGTPDADKIISGLGANENGYQVLVISDYAKGVCTPDLCRRLIAWAKENGVKTVVDPKGEDWTKYNGANVITPNEREWTASLARAAPPTNYLVTLGARGMELYQRHFTETTKIPAINVVPKDVCGAGDTVTATLAACLAIGYDLPEAARIANVAASIAVSKAGTATVSLEELEAALCQ